MARRNRAARRRARQGEVIEAKKVRSDLAMVDGFGNGGWTTIYDSSTDPQYWQKHINPHSTDLFRNAVVWGCQTLIAGDIAKMAPLIMEENTANAKLGPILQRADKTPFAPLFRNPNGFQTWFQFTERWMLSKLSRGNTYALKERDGRNMVRAMYVLHPDRCQPLVAPDGSVYYRLLEDDLAGVPSEADNVVPASEIIHDRFNCLFHPLVGLSPLFAAALSAGQGLTIQEESSKAFSNGSRPGGILTSPQTINEDLAKRYKQRWEEMNRAAGRTVVLGNGLDFKPIAQSAVENELVKQLDMTAQQICMAYHVPGYKLGVGPAPTYQNTEAYDQVYYDSCLQVHATAIEALLDDGVGLEAAGYCFKFNLDDLIKMDSSTMTDVIAKQMAAGLLSPNEGRAKLNRLPVKGGESPARQQQMYSLEALAERDQAKPFSKPAPAAPAVPGPAANDPNAEGAAAKGIDIFCKELDEHVFAAA